MKSYSNPDLTVISDNKARWNTPSHRRNGFHQFHQNNRYGIMMRSDTVLQLDLAINPEIEKLEQVNFFINQPIFSAMVVAKEQTILFEKYANDFHPNQPHTIQSITKLLVNLMIGKLYAKGKIDLDKTVDYYLPEIGSGYAKASIQNVLDMNIENRYTEDYTDPYTACYLQESTVGLRLPDKNETHITQYEFLSQIESDDLTNHDGTVKYKSANTDVLGWIVERITQQPLRTEILEIVEATGFEGALHCSTDRIGFPNVNGGVSLSARDLARFGLLFARFGEGISGRSVGDSQFIQHTVNKQSPYYSEPRAWIKYSNQSFSDGHWIGHGGYGGQFMLTNLETGVTCVFFSVLENDCATDMEYQVKLIRMLEQIAATY